MGIEIQEEFSNIFQENLQLIQANLSNIEIKEIDSQRLKWSISLKKTCGVNIINIPPQLESIIYNLFNGIVNKDQSGVKKTKKGFSFEDCIKNKGVFDEECYELFPNQIIDKIIVKIL